MRELPEISSMHCPQGVVFSSGGANGAYEVGVLKALLNGKSPATQMRPIDPAVFVGSSIGALNSAFMVSHAADYAAMSAVHGLERLWLEQLAASNHDYGNGAFRVRENPLRFFDPRNLLANPFSSLSQFAIDNAVLARDFLERTASLLGSDESIEQRLIQTLDLSSFLSTDPLMKLIRREDVNTLHLSYVDTEIENIPIGELRSTASAMYRMMVTVWANQINAGVEAVTRIN